MLSNADTDSPAKTAFAIFVGLLFIMAVAIAGCGDDTPLEAPVETPPLPLCGPTVGVHKCDRDPASHFAVCEDESPPYPVKRVTNCIPEAGVTCVAWCVSSADTQ